MRIERDRSIRTQRNSHSCEYRATSSRLPPFVVVVLLLSLRRATSVRVTVTDTRVLVSSSRREKTSQRERARGAPRIDPPPSADGRGGLPRGAAAAAVSVRASDRDKNY